MKPLSNTQKKILKAASKQPKLPIEEHMVRYRSPAVRRQIVYSLLNSGYVSEDSDYHYITDEGIAALSAKKAKAAKPAKPEKQKMASIGKAKKTAKASAAEKKSDGPAKGRQLLIDILSYDGATLQQMADATRWQKGAVSGTMSKIKKMLAPEHKTIVSSKNDNGQVVYRIAEMTAA